MHEAVDALAFTDNRNLLSPHLIANVATRVYQMPRP
jgi:hypothetical protein